MTRSELLRSSSLKTNGQSSHATNVLKLLLAREIGSSAAPTFTRASVSFGMRSPNVSCVRLRLTSESPSARSSWASASQPLRPNEKINNSERKRRHIGRDRAPAGSRGTRMEQSIRPPER